MPAVTIEQNLEGRQTYLRLRNVGRLLNKPQYGIGADSNEMLGPEGWKNQVIVNEAPQYLDGNDLLLEIDARLINYLEPGRAIEIQIAELGLTERIQPPPLMSFPSSKTPLPPGATVYGFVRTSFVAGAPDPVPQKRADEKPQPPPIPVQDAAPPAEDRTVEVKSEADQPSGQSEEQTPVGDVKKTEVDSGSGGSDAATAKPDDTKDADKSGEEKKPEKSPQHNWRSLAAALLVGLIVGFFGKYLADEYVPGSGQSTNATAKRTIALLQTDAFGPLTDDLKQIPQKSPLGMTPDTLPGITPLTVNRGRSFYNYGAQKAREGQKPEAIYWYKRAVQTLEVDALTFLGDGYLNGDGVPRDPRTGYQLLRLAAGLGSEKARNYLVDQLGSGHIQNAPTTMGQAFVPR
jgi:hypothetical protein